MTTTTRIYLPLSLEALSALGTSGDAGPSSMAFTVTPELVAELGPAEDEEGREFAAMQDAAMAAAVRGDHVVAAADVDGTDVEPEHDSDLPPSQVRLTRPVGLRRIASFHLLDPVGERDVDSDLELSWYDVTELDVIRQVVAGR